MKNSLILVLLFFGTLSYGQISRGGVTPKEENTDEEKSNVKPLAPDYSTKQKVADCNQDLDLEESNNLIYHKRTRKPFTGSCVSYYDNQQMERMVSFIIGKENGTSYNYYENGQIAKQTYYKDGELDGKFTAYYRNGQIQWEKNYKDGKKDGKATWYYDNGQIEKEEYFKDGKLIGE